MGYYYLCDYYVISLFALFLFVFQKENEKAMEELRKFYSAQAIKHKENMEQAVSLKVSGIQQTLF